MIIWVVVGVIVYVDYFASWMVLCSLLIHVLFLSSCSSVEVVLGCLPAASFSVPCSVGPRKLFCLGGVLISG